MLKSRKASVFIYILILINIALIIWYVVWNNVFILNNNINTWKNSEEIFSSIHNKWNINIESVKKYNSNWDWFIDGISCPQNVTMSWTTLMTTGINTTITYSLWNIYCSWAHNWKEFRIYFDKDYSDFAKVFYDGYIIDISKSLGTIIELWTTNIALSSTITWSTSISSTYSVSKSADNNISTYFHSKNKSSNEYLNYQFSSNKKIWMIKIKKDSQSSSNYWDNWEIYLYNSSWALLNKITITWMKSTIYKEIDLKYSWLTDDVRLVKIKVNWKYLDIKEFEIYELVSSWSEEKWVWNTSFWDTDNTIFSFTSLWIWWWDNIDDDFNSDNYRAASDNSTYYSNSFQDDDVVPRLTFFWSINIIDNYYNIFWSNYKTNEFVRTNTYNNDGLNSKIWSVTNWYMLLDLYREDWNLNYDMKIIEFNRELYEDNFTLLPINSTEWLNLTQNIWYIQSNSWVLSLSQNKTWKEYVFDFKNKDYAIFINNKVKWKLSYKLTWETTTWTNIYINPINENELWTIKSLSNHVIIWAENTFIWEDFIIIWTK